MSKDGMRVASRDLNVCAGCCFIFSNSLLPRSLESSSNTISVTAAVCNLCFGSGSL